VYPEILGMQTANYYQCYNFQTSTREKAQHTYLLRKPQKSSLLGVPQLVDESVGNIQNLSKD